MTSPVDAPRPWLSVLLPTHGGARWIATTLDSLVAQTSQGFECILIDSSPDDCTVAIAEGYRDRLNLRIERRQDIKDWMRKTNLAAELAQAEHVCMLHQDDVWEPHRADRVKQWLDDAPDAVMHLHPTWIIDPCDRKLGLWRCPLPSTADVPAELFRNRLIVQNFVATCAPIMRRDAYLAVGGLDSALWYTSDWDLYLKLGRLGRVVYHAEPLTGFRIHAQSQTVTGSRAAADFEDQMTKVLRRHQDGVSGDVLARARAAITVNTTLAAALHKQKNASLRAVAAVAALGPRGVLAFLRDTRLIERVWPRLRVHVTQRLSA